MTSNTSRLSVRDALSILNIQSNQVTIEDVKIAYRRAANKFHPDHNPAGLETMKLVNLAYELLKNQDFTKAEFTNHGTGSYDYGEIINKALNAIIDLQGLAIEICGTWVWVGGNTKEHRETLKQAGFFWAHNKALWYFRPETSRSYNRSSWDMEKIRSTYGYSSIKEQGQLMHH